METSRHDALNRFNYLLGETDALYHELANRLGLSDSALRILYTLCDQGDPCALQEICRRSGLNKQTVNSALRKLEQEGVLYLQSTGPRTKQVCLTGSGRALARRTAGRIIQMGNTVLAAWDVRDVKAYLAYTERFLGDMRQQAAALAAEEEAL